MDNSLREAVIEKCILHLMKHHNLDEKKAYAVFNDILCIIQKGDNVV